MNFLTVTAYRRPHMLLQMLRTLLDNELDGWAIRIAVEPSSLAPAMVRLAESLLAGKNIQVRVNDRRLGIIENPRRLIDDAFEEGASLVLHIEEDLLLSPDATRLAAWFGGHHQPEWLCLNLLSGGCGSAGLISQADFPDILFASHMFNSIGFAVRRQEWLAHMRPAWTKATRKIVRPNGEVTCGWDWSVSAALLHDPLLRTVHPALARATHNGRTGGEYCTTAFHDLAFEDLALYAGQPAIAAYRLLRHDELPGILRRHLQLSNEMFLAWKALQATFSSVSHEVHPAMTPQ